jgi:hypothetical protein
MSEPIIITLIIVGGIVAVILASMAFDAIKACSANKYKAFALTKGGRDEQPNARQGK